MYIVLCPTGGGCAVGGWRVAWHYNFMLYFFSRADP
jgi:hypothetical protein